MLRLYEPPKKEASLTDLFMKNNRLSARFIVKQDCAITRMKVLLVKCVDVAVSTIAMLFGCQCRLALELQKQIDDRQSETTNVARQSRPLF